MGEFVQDSAGNLYGTTAAGGAYNWGTVFKLNPAGAVTILYSFTAESDGREPLGGLLRDTEGNLYGTTWAGGSGDGIGTVFKLDANNTITTLHTFGFGSDGAEPLSRLVTINGDFYGVTMYGGDYVACPSGCGTIFKVTKGGTETVLHRFRESGDGSYPQGLIRDSAGNLYGVTAGGAVWKLDPDGVVFTVLYTFTGGTDGGNPYGRLLRNTTNGSLRGVTSGGGDPSCQCGVVFSLDESGHERVIHRFFRNGGGANPLVGLLDVDGTLYGMAKFGGDLTCIDPHGCGVLYQIGKTGQFTVLHRFAGQEAADGAYPLYGAVTEGDDGSLYGVTWGGGTGTGCGNLNADGCGTIFKYTP